MGLGYQVMQIERLPVVYVKITFPPRLDVERMFSEIAMQASTLIDTMPSEVYRINDLSAFNLIPIASQVIRGMHFEVKGRPGTNTDPRVTSILVGKGSNIELLVEALRKPEFGSWNIASFDTLDSALSQIGRWEDGTDPRPAKHLQKENEPKAARTVI
jgi:hypothetical protein